MSVLISMTETQQPALRSSARTSSEASAAQKCLHFCIAEAFPVWDHFYGNVLILARLRRSFRAMPIPLLGIGSTRIKS